MSYSLACLSALSRGVGSDRQVKAERKRYADVYEIKPLVVQRLVKLWHLPRWQG